MKIILIVMTTVLLLAVSVFSVNQYFEALRAEQKSRLELYALQRENKELRATNEHLRVSLEYLLKDNEKLKNGRK